MLQPRRKVRRKSRREGTLTHNPCSVLAAPPKKGQSGLQLLHKEFWEHEDTSKDTEVPILKAPTLNLRTPAGLW